MAVGVAKNLDLHMARPLHVFFEINLGIAKSVQRFGGGVSPSRGHIRFRRNEAHAFAAAAGNRFRAARESQSRERYS